MALTQQEKDQLLRGLMRDMSRKGVSTSLLKSDIAAAIDSTDSWIESNQASFNSSLPSAAQSGLNATQKTYLFCLVALTRNGADTLKQVVGEID